MRNFFVRLLPPILLLVIGTVLTIYIAFSVLVSDNGPALFEFKAGEKKLTSFGIFKDAIIGGPGTHHSSVVKLYLDLFERSITKNYDMPAGDQIQKYNYAVTQSGVIVVAVWTAQDHYDHLNMLKKDPDHCDKDNNWRPAKNPPSALLSTEGLVMINIFPEKQDVPVSPCWVKLPSGEPMGLLEGSSKHLILAQWPRNWWNTFVEDLVKAKVRGAGEITVILSGSECVYTINDNSGTYKPYNLANLRKVASWFGESLEDNAPQYINDHDKGFLHSDEYSISEENAPSRSLKCRKNG